MGEGYRQACRIRFIQLQDSKFLAKKITSTNINFILRGMAMSAIKRLQCNTPSAQILLDTKLRKG